MADIIFRPTCSSCGNIIWDYIDCEKRITYEKNINEKYCEYVIIPRKCKRCGAYLGNIIMPQTLPFDNRRQVMRIAK